MVLERATVPERVRVVDGVVEFSAGGRLSSATPDVFERLADPTVIPGVRERDGVHTILDWEAGSWFVANGIVDGLYTPRASRPLLYDCGCTRTGLVPVDQVIVWDAAGNEGRQQLHRYTSRLAKNTRFNEQALTWAAAQMVADKTLANNPFHRPKR